MVFCLTCEEERLDTALQICEALLQSDFVKDTPDNRESVLDLLVTISLKKHDNEQWLRWATEKANFCRQGRAYLSKSTLKELRANFKIDIKLHPKQHRK